ncbi:DUF4097 family beta strand repeat-containing protein [Peribacillus sp. NPDC097675]|uniref:DUF4097 family beta strand repeat-containing protein n=1 Tax=Peribacillus sp. NPDC097675 TaxID=3390618 RepID=UPI003D05750E
MRNLNRRFMFILTVSMLGIFMAACGSDTTSDVEPKSFEAKEIEEIFVTTDGQNIEMRPSDNEKVKVSAKAGKEVPITLEGTVLTVDLEGSSSLINFKTDTLYVEVPRKIFKKISLNTTAGKISGKKITAEELIVTADSGQIDINGFEGKKIGGEIVAGDMNLKKIEGKFSLTNDTGDIDISYKGVLEENSTITTHSGKVIMKFESKPNSLQVKASTGSGKIKNSLFSSEELKVEGGKSILNGKIGSGGATLSIQSASGTIYID